MCKSNCAHIIPMPGSSDEFFIVRMMRVHLLSLTFEQLSKTCKTSARKSKPFHCKNVAQFQISVFYAIVYRWVSEKNVWFFLKGLHFKSVPYSMRAKHVLTILEDWFRTKKQYSKQNPLICAVFVLKGFVNVIEESFENENSLIEINFVL